MVIHELQPETQGAAAFQSPETSYPGAEMGPGERGGMNGESWGRVGGEGEMRAVSGRWGDGAAGASC